MSIRIKTEDGDIILSGKGKDGKDGTSGIPVPQTAEVGQVLSVKAVDDNGKPTEWECIENGGGSGDSIFEEIPSQTVYASNISKWVEVCVVPPKCFAFFQNFRNYSSSSSSRYSYSFTNLYPQGENSKLVKISSAYNPSDVTNNSAVVFYNPTNENQKLYCHYYYDSSSGSITIGGGYIVRP